MIENSFIKIHFYCLAGCSKQRDDFNITVMKANLFFYILIVTINNGWRSMTEAYVR